MTRVYNLDATDGVSYRGRMKFKLTLDELESMVASLYHDPFVTDDDDFSDALYDVFDNDNELIIVGKKDTWWLSASSESLGHVLAMRHEGSVSHAETIHLATTSEQPCGRLCKISAIQADASRAVVDADGLVISGEKWKLDSDGDGYFYCLVSKLGWISAASNETATERMPFEAGMPGDNPVGVFSSLAHAAMALRSIRDLGRAAAALEQQKERVELRLEKLKTQR